MHYSMAADCTMLEVCIANMPKQACVTTCWTVHAVALAQPPALPEDTLVLKASAQLTNFNLFHLV